MHKAALQLSSAGSTEAKAVFYSLQEHSTLRQAPDWPAGDDLSACPIFTGSHSEVLQCEREGGRTVWAIVAGSP